MGVQHGGPVQATINVLSGKWKVQAIWRLSFGPLRFAELGKLAWGLRLWVHGPLGQNRCDMGDGYFY